MICAAVASMGICTVVTALVDESLTGTSTGGLASWVKRKKVAPRPASKRALNERSCPGTKGALLAGATLVMAAVVKVKAEPSAGTAVPAASSQLFPVVSVNPGNNRVVYVVSGRSGRLVKLIRTIRGSAS